MSEEMRTIEIPVDANRIIEVFNEGGFETYAVGGCVRDSIMGRPVHDWDMCTSAKAEEIIKICMEHGFKYIPTGLKHGTITIVINKENYEITTFRIDGDYSDGRHPDNVLYTPSLREDLARRDFTINALAYNNRVKIIDYFGGTQDIEDSVIRCVGNPHERFNEDNLRRLRAVRFASQLGFQIEHETYEQLKQNIDKLSLISPERIREELCKILMSDNAAYGIRELVRLGMMKYIIPELEMCVGFEQHNRHHDRDVFEHALCVLDNVPKKLELRLSALLHDIGKPCCLTIGEDGQGHFLGHNIEGTRISEIILKRLKFDNRTIERVCTLVKYHMDRYDKIKLPGIKRFINRVGIENLEDLFELQIADIKGSAVEYQNYKSVLKMKEKCAVILSEKHPLSIKDLDIDGNDLIEMGYMPGREIGEILKKLLECVLEKPELNKRDELVKLIKTIHN